MSQISELDDEVKYSNLNILSFSMYQVTWTVIIAALNLTYFIFYHTVVGLHPFLIFLAIGIYTVWDSINEPLIGYLVDRNFKWTRKWGRRFPWIVIGIIPFGLSFYLIYTPPNIDGATNPWPIFGWLVMSYFIFDIFLTLLDINVGTLRADKFRTDLQRRRYSKYFGPIDMISQALGMMLPTIFLALGTGRQSFSTMAIAISLIGIISGISFLPGAREDKTIIDRYFSRGYEKMSFFKGIKEVLKQKSFLAFFASYTSFTVATTLMTAMGLYVTTFIFDVSEDIFTVLMAIFLIGAMISVFLWHKYLNKINNTKRVYTIGGMALCATMIFASFFITLYDFFVIFFIIGLAMGCIWTLGVPVVLSDVQDDYVIRTEKNQKGMLLGTWALVSKFTTFIDELLIAIVFTLVAFPSGLETYQELVASGANVPLIQWGIRFLLGIIPMLILLIGVITFWKKYPLTPEKILENKSKLKELGF
ncbi:MAG: MFS transporter [Promethearchaeota archaeon]